MFWLWPQAKKPRLFDFGTRAKVRLKFWLRIGFGLAWDFARPKPKFGITACQKAAAFGFQDKAGAWIGFGLGLEAIKVRPKPQLSGQAKAGTSLLLRIGDVFSYILFQDGIEPRLLRRLIKMFNQVQWCSVHQI
ncbi:hypothetical protein C8J57DRAFT_1230693 [Mycena rebaudengoi]|nr:hypothetical protein C8J57DRAFT_1230693 [Mycena rebaudengoi]